MRLLFSIVWVALGAGCGARSGIAGGSFGADGAVDPTPVGDADGGAVVRDSGVGGDAVAGSCLVTSVAVACAGPEPGGGDCAAHGCKLNVEWSCGDVTYRVDGACAPPDAGPLGGFYEGVCDENGAQTSTFQVSTTTCDCKDQTALATLVQGFCTHQ